MTIFDSHAHLDEDCFQADFDEIVARMRQNHVDYMMNVGCDLPSSVRSAAMAEQYPWVYAAVGSHPDDADHVCEDYLLQYRALCENKKVRAIGEIGLDYHYEDVPRQVQQKAFRMQMALAEQLQMPVIVHEREAHEDALAILQEFPTVKGVFHCFSGSAEMARELVKKGWYIGFTGVLTFKNARKAVQTAMTIPLDRILIETDCPYMAPEPCRGRRNDPSLVSLVCRKLAEIREISMEEAAKATTENAKRLFGIA